MISKIIHIIKTIIAQIGCRESGIDSHVWVFSSSYNEKFNYNSKYLFEYVLEHESEIKPLYVINDERQRIKLQETYGKEYFIETKSISGIKKVLNSGVWFTSAGLPIYGFNLGKNRIIVNLWHGVPLKKIALLENNLNKLVRFYFKVIFSNNYTFVLTTSENLKTIMAKSFGVSSKKVKVLGQPRNDNIYKENNQDDILKSLYSELPNYKTIILYAPTFREDTETVYFPFENFEKKELEFFLESNEMIIFIRSHQSETIKVEELTVGKRVKLINADLVDDIMEIINIFDMVITDYSSIYIDFLQTEKPVLFLPYDKQEYIKNRGLNFNYDEVTPGPKPTDFEKFKKELVRLLNNKEYYSIERTNVNSFFNEVKRDNSYRITEFMKDEINKL